MAFQNSYGSFELISCLYLYHLNLIRCVFSLMFCSKAFQFCPFPVYKWLHFVLQERFNNLALNAFEKRYARFAIDKTNTLWYFVQLYASRPKRHGLVWHIFYFTLSFLKLLTHD